MSEAVANSILAGFVGVYVVFLIAIIIFIVLLLIERIVLFRKCGIAWWKAIIPLYSDYVMDVQICGVHWVVFVVHIFLSFGIYTQIVNSLVRAIIYYNLAKKFHKDPVPATIFGAILPFNAIVELVYAFGSSYTYDPNEPVGNLGFINRVVK